MAAVVSAEDFRTDLSSAVVPAEGFQINLNSAAVLAGGCRIDSHSAAGAAVTGHQTGSMTKPVFEQWNYQRVP